MNYTLLLLLALISGCATNPSVGEKEYTRFSVSDLDGTMIAEWIAEGRVKKTDIGYEITAVERRTAPPYPTTNRYPNGRKATVTGPNIILENVPKPDWLEQLDIASAP